MVSAKGPIIACTIFTLYIGLGCLLFTDAFLALYKIPSGKFTKFQMDLIKVSMMFWGLQSLMNTFLQVMALRSGSQRARANIAFANGVCMTLACADGLLRLMPACTSIGMPVAGIIASALVNALIALANFAGSFGEGGPSLNKDKAPPTYSLCPPWQCPPMYASLRFTSYIFVFFGVTIYCFPGAMMQQYGVDGNGASNDFVQSAFQTLGMLNFFTCLLIGSAIFAHDQFFTYLVNRFLFFYYLTVIVFAAMNIRLCEVIGLDNAASGQYFNVALCLVGHMLAFRGQSPLDAHLKPYIEAFKEAAPSGYAPAP